MVKKSAKNSCFKRFLAMLLALMLVGSVLPPPLTAYGAEEASVEEEADSAEEYLPEEEPAGEALPEEEKPPEEEKEPAEGSQTESVEESKASQTEPAEESEFLQAESAGEPDAVQQDSADEAEPEASSEEPYGNYVYGDPDYNGNYSCGVDEDGKEIPELYSQDVGEIIAMAEAGMDLARFFDSTIFKGFTVEDLILMRDEGYSFERIAYAYTGGVELPGWLSMALARGASVRAYEDSGSTGPNSLISTGVNILAGSALGVIPALGSGNSHGPVKQLTARGDDGLTYAAFCAKYGGSYSSGWTYSKADCSSLTAPNGNALTQYHYNLIKVVINTYLKTTQQMDQDYAAAQLIIWYIINNLGDDEYYDPAVAWENGISEAAAKIYPNNTGFIYNTIFAYSYYINMFMDGELDMDNFPNNDLMPGRHAEIQFWGSTTDNSQWIVTWSMGVGGTAVNSLSIPYIDNAYMEKKASARYTVDVTKESVITNELLSGIDFEVVESEASGHDLSYEIYTGSGASYGTDYPNATIGDFGQATTVRDEVPYMDDDVEPSGGRHRTVITTDGNGHASTTFLHTHTFREFYSTCYKDLGIEIDYAEYQAQWEKVLEKADELAEGETLAVSYLGVIEEMDADTIKGIYDQQQIVYTQTMQQAASIISENYNAYMGRTYAYTVQELDKYNRLASEDSNGKTLEELSLPIEGYRKDVKDVTTIEGYRKILGSGETMIVGGTNDSDTHTAERNVTDEPWYNQIFINKTDLETNSQILYDTDFQIYEYYAFKRQVTAAEQQVYPAVLLNQMITRYGTSLMTDHIVAANLRVESAGREFLDQELDAAELAGNLDSPYAMSVGFTPSGAGEYQIFLEITVDNASDTDSAKSTELEGAKLVETGEGIYQLYARAEHRLSLVSSTIATDSESDPAVDYVTADGGTIRAQTSADTGITTYLYTMEDGTEQIYTSNEDLAYTGIEDGELFFCYFTAEDTGITLYSEDGESYTGSGGGNYYTNVVFHEDGSVTLYYFPEEFLPDGVYTQQDSISVSENQMSIGERNTNVGTDPDDYTTWGQANYEIVRVTADIAKKMGWSDTTIGMYTVHRLSPTDQYAGTTFSSAKDETTGELFGYFEYGTLYYTQANLGRFCIVEEAAPKDRVVNGYLGNYADRDYTKLSEESAQKNSDGAPYGTEDEVSTEKIVHYLHLCADTNQYASYMLTDGYGDYDSLYYTNYVETLDNAEGTATEDGYDAHGYAQSSLKPSISLERFSLDKMAGDPVNDTLNRYWDEYMNRYLSEKSGILVNRDSEKSDTYFALREALNCTLNFVGTAIHVDSFDNGLSAESEITFHGSYTDTQINYHSYVGASAAFLNGRHGFQDTEYLQVGEVTYDNGEAEKKARFQSTQAAVNKARGYAFIDERTYGFLRFTKYDADAERYVNGNLDDGYEAGTDHGDAGLDGAFYSLYVSEDNSFTVSYYEGTLDGRLFWAQPLNTGGFRLIFDGDEDADNGFTDLGTNSYDDYEHASLMGEGSASENFILCLDYTDEEAQCVNVTLRTAQYQGIRHPDGRYGGEKHNGWYAVLEEQQVFVDADEDGYGDTWTLQDVTLEAGAKVASAAIRDGEFQMDGLYLGEYDLVEEIRDSIVVFSTDNDDEEASEIKWLSFAPGYLAAVDSDGNPIKYHYSFPYEDEMISGTSYSAEQIYIQKETDSVSRQQVVKGAGFQINKQMTDEESAASGNTQYKALEGAGFTVYLLSELSLIKDGTILPAFSEAEGNLLLYNDELTALFDETDNFAGYQFTEGYILANHPFEEKYGGTDYDLEKANRLVYVADRGYYFMEDILEAYRNQFYSNETEKWDFSGESLAIARMYEDDASAVEAVNSGYDYKTNHLNSGSPCEWYGVNGISEGWQPTGVRNEYRLAELFTNHYGHIKSPELSWGAYLVVETTTPPDVFTVEPFFVTVSDSSATENRTKYVTETDSTIVASLVMVKRDAQSGQDVVLSGVSYRIWDYQKNDYVKQYLYGTNGELSVIQKSVFVTDEEGRIDAVASLEKGYYRLEELSGPEGYYNQYADIGLGSVDFEVTTERRYLSSGIVSNGNLDYLYIGELYYNDETVGKLTILKTGEVLTGCTTDEEGNYEFVYEERPLADAVYQVTAAENICTQDGNGGTWFQKGDVVATVETGADGEIVSFAPNYRTAEDSGSGSYDYTYYYGDTNGTRTSLTNERTYEAEEFASTGSIQNDWIESRMSERDLALYGVPAYTDETIYPNTFYREQNVRILRRLYRSSSAQELIDTDYVTHLEEEGNISTDTAFVLTETDEGYRLTNTRMAACPRANLRANDDGSYDLILTDGSVIEVEESRNLFRVTEGISEPWSAGDFAERTASGWQLTHTDKTEAGVSRGAAADGAADLGFTHVETYESASIRENEDGTWTLIDKEGEELAILEDGILMTSDGGIVSKTADGYQVETTTYEEIEDNPYVDAKLKIRGAELTVKSETSYFLWDSLNQRFVTTSGSVAELSENGGTLTVKTGETSTAYTAFDFTIEYDLHFASKEDIVRVEKDGTLGEVYVYLPLGKYQVQEIRPPYGFVGNDLIQTVEFTYTDQTEEVVFDAENEIVHYYNLRVRPVWKEGETEIGVGIYKVDKDTLEPLAGTRFGLYTTDDIYNIDGELLAAAGTLLATAITDETGYANFGTDIPLMSRYLDEEESDAELVYPKTMPPSLVTVSIDGNTGINTGDYYIQEITPPDGYLMDDTIHSVSFQYQGENILYIPVYADHANEQTEIGLTKYDVTGDEEVPGAKISLYKVLDLEKKDESGYYSHADDNLELLEQWVSTEKEHVLKGLLLSNEEWPRISAEEEPENVYVFREELPAPGYATAADIEFKLYQICGEDGSWTDENGEPCGYEVLVSHISEEDGSIVWEALEDLHAAMYDDYTKLEVSKIDAITEEELAGAKLEIWTADDNGEPVSKVETWTTGEDGFDENGFPNRHPVDHLPIGSYVLVESAAPEGYLIAENVPFEITDTGLLQEIRMIDSVTCLNVFKYQADTTVTVAGAVVDIYAVPDEYLQYLEETLEEEASGSEASDTEASDEKPELVIELTEDDLCLTAVTDLNGSTILTLEPGWYAAVESKAPDGYALDSEPQVFYLGDENANRAVQFYNHRISAYYSSGGGDEPETETEIETPTAWNNVRTEDTGEYGYSIKVKIAPKNPWESVPFLPVCAGAALICIGCLGYVRIRKKGGKNR